ncbi:MAG: hypothetical protein OXD34_08360 [bacterium]|nr:hypothetical protein [bacterium]
MSRPSSHPSDAQRRPRGGPVSVGVVTAAFSNAHQVVGETREHASPFESDHD